jgi:diguanylate cyclase (GGDEF)-like protein/PAS domain S-box-containing protein
MRKGFRSVVAQQYFSLFHFHPDGVVGLSLDGEILDINPALLSMLGFEKEELVGQSFLAFISEGNAERCLHYIEEIKDGVSHTLDITIPHKNGQRIEINVTGAPLIIEGQVEGIFGVAKDMTRSKRRERELLESERRYRSLVEWSPDAIIVHQNAVVRYVNPAAAKLAQVDNAAEMIGDNIFSFIHPDFREASIERYKRRVEKRRKSGKTLETDLKVVLKDGTPFIGEVNSILIEIDGNPATLTMIKDVTARHQAENQLKQLAYFDSLTGLPNRRMFKESLTGGLERMEKGSHDLAVLFLDIDRFKYINDTFGHLFGDKILQIIGERLKACVGERGTMARMGGDEFTMVLEPVTHSEQILSMAKDMLAQFRDPILIDDHELMLTPSIGIAVAPFDGEDADTLMRHADAAMYRSKEQGGNQFAFYTTAISVNHYERIVLENDLRRALERKEFLLHYQPKLDAKTRKIVSMEALVRWWRPGNGMVSPGAFIPLAEETGLIIALGEWVLREACRQNKAWQEHGYPPMRVAVNVSAKQFHQSNVVEMIQRVLDETGLEPEWLEIEITESTIMKNAEGVIATVQQLKRMGVHIAIDDFGTGYSSLGYLRRFHLNTLKIDRSFLQDVLVDSENAIIVSAIINLAHNLKLNVVAEGVETEEQLAFLIEQGCDEVQGYLFSPPISAEKFASLLE